MDEILRLQKLLNIERSQLLCLAREIAEDATVRGIYELRPSHQYALLLILEQIRDETPPAAITDVRKCAAMV